MGWTPRLSGSLFLPFFRTVLSVDDSPRLRRRQQIRERILAVARQIFETEGPQAVTMRRVAAAADYSTMALYGHFADREDLLHSITREAFATFEQDLRDVEGATAWERLERGCQCYIRFGLRQPDDYRLAFAGGDRRAAQGPPAGQAAFDILRRMIRDCQAEGDLPGTDPDFFAQSIWAGLHGLASILLGFRGFPFFEKETLLQHHVRLLLQGARNMQEIPSDAGITRIFDNNCEEPLRKSAS